MKPILQYGQAISAWLNGKATRHNVRVAGVNAIIAGNNVSGFTVTYGPAGRIISPVPGYMSGKYGRNG